MNHVNAFISQSDRNNNVTSGGGGNKPFRVVDSWTGTSFWLVEENSAPWVCLNNTSTKRRRTGMQTVWVILGHHHTLSSRARSMGVRGNGGSIFSDRVHRPSQQSSNARGFGKNIRCKNIGLPGPGTSYIHYTHTYICGEITWGIYLRHLPGTNHFGELPEEFTWDKPLGGITWGIYLRELPEEFTWRNLPGGITWRANAAYARCTWRLTFLRPSKPESLDVGFGCSTPTRK